MEHTKQSLPDGFEELHGKPDRMEVTLQYFTIGGYMAKRELYVVELPDEFDYAGKVKHTWGTVEAVSERQAVYKFIMASDWKGNKQLYERFRDHFGGHTEQFAARAARAVAAHYARKYTADPQFTDRLNYILGETGIEWDGVDRAALVDAMESYYKAKWGSDTKRMRSVCRSVRNRSGNMLAELDIIGDCGPI